MLPSASIIVHPCVRAWLHVALASRLPKAAANLLGTGVTLPRGLGDLESEMRWKAELLRSFPSIPSLFPHFPFIHSFPEICRKLGLIPAELELLSGSLLLPAAAFDCERAGTFNCDSCDVWTGPR